LALDCVDGQTLVKLTIASVASMPDYQIFEAGDVLLQSGLTYRGARLAYKTYGMLDAAKSNTIVYPTSYGAQHYDLEWAIAEGKALDPTKFFIVIMNKFGNGLSSRSEERRVGKECRARATPDQ